jgi:F-type H+-transporting ATPase subunit a
MRVDHVTLTTVLAATSEGGGFPAPSIEEFEWPCIGPSYGHVFGYDVCFNRVPLLMIIAAVIVLAMFYFAFRQAQLVPRGFQNAMEVGVEFVRNNIVLEVIGPKGLPFMPYLLSLFFFIFIGNLMGVVPPFLFPVNSRIAVPLFLALCSWLLFNYAGIKEQGLSGYLRSTLFPPGIPWWVYILVTPIEFVSTFLVRPFTLAVRLLANMIAGHLVLAVFFLGAAYLFTRPLTAVFGAGSFLAGVIFVLFELLVAVLQAYIFTILNAVYLAGAIEPEH